MSAGGSVTCDEIEGSAFAGSSIRGDAFETESDWDGSKLGETLSGLGEKISAAVGKAARKGWPFHKSRPFGEGQVKMDLDLEPDEEE